MVRVASLFISFTIFIVTLLFVLKFDSSLVGFQYVSEIVINDEHNFKWKIGLDGISLIFIILTTFLTPLAILCSIYTVKLQLKRFLTLILFVEFFLLCFFLTIDILFFYIFFEVSLIPLFLLIFFFGHRERRTKAANYFLFFTVFGSCAMLVAIVYFYSLVNTLDLELIYYLKMSKALSFKNTEHLLFLGFFLPFAIKLPTFPFHIWLPEAHAEAPTAGSVLLAGILLKMGAFGLLRINLPIFTESCYFFLPLVITLCLTSLIYMSATALRQVDIKKIIAYSSIVHMNFCLLGLFSFKLEAIQGALFLLIGHGLSASALFLLIGFLYDRYHTRNLLYYTALVNFMPVWSIFFFFAILTNISFPGTCNFIGELLIATGLVKSFHFTIAAFTLFSTFFNVAFSIWFFNRLVYGPFHIKKYNKLSHQFYKWFFNFKRLNHWNSFVFMSYVYNRTTLTDNFVPYKYYSDLTRREFFTISPIVLVILLLGFFPNILFNLLHVYSLDFIFITNFNFLK